MKGIIEKHPELDFFVYFMGGNEILTKQDKFKPLKERSLYEKKGKDFIKINSKDLYEKKELKHTHKNFEKQLKSKLLKQVENNKEFPIKKSQKVEVVIVFNMTEKRLKIVDIDNLTKSILDCMIGIIFDDDSQVVNILAEKNIHPIYPINGLMIGVRKIKDDNSDSWFRDIKLAFAYEKE